MSKPPYLEVAKRALKKHYPDAVGGFVAGSVVMGQGTETSDLDIAVLFEEGGVAPHRNTVLEERWLIEFFVHTPKAQNFYFEKDRQRGMCVMPHIVSSGMIIPCAHPLLTHQKQKAERIIAAGPPALTQEACDLLRYTICALQDDLRDARDGSARNAIAVALHERLGDFYLRSQSKWSGTARSLLKRLREADMEFAEKFEHAFAMTFENGNSIPLLELIDRVIEPFGGRLQEGMLAYADPSWESYEEPDS